MNIDENSLIELKNENVNSAAINDTVDDSIYFIDDPCDEKNDSIGFSVYVNSLISAINSNAKMIGLISNFGSGKSTILHMMKNRTELKDKTIKICSINLWNLPSNQKTKNPVDLTIDIHKSLLNQLINNSDFDEHTRSFLKKQTNKNYGFLDISVEDKNIMQSLYFLFALFIFSTIMKIEVGNFFVAKAGIFILDLCFAINLVYILSKAKLYFSFNKESKNTREIDEYETVECFLNIIQKNKDIGIKKMIICIEDIDRFANKSDAIRFLEQVYKFYNESIHIKDMDIKFIVTIKPAIYFENDHRIENDTVKDIYEKIFDFILTLNPVAIQNYDALLEELLLPKKSHIERIGLTYPGEKKLFYWSYLYKGNKVTVRDIKHRYNYSINLYCNLKEQMDKLEDENISINKETCFYISYLEDSFTNCFYKLVTNSYDFEKMVTDYLMNGKLKLCSKCNFEKECLDSNAINETKCTFAGEVEFYKEIKYGLDNGLIDSNFSMYFYKFPKGKKIKNIYDVGIKNILLKNDSSIVSDLTEYSKKCSEKEIIECLEKMIEINRIPDVIFKDKRLFEITYDNYLLKLNEFILKYDISKDEKKTLILIMQLNKLKSEKADHMLLNLIIETIKILQSSVEENKIINIRLKILCLIINKPEIYYELFTKEMPVITKEEIKQIDEINKVLKIINASQVNDEVIDNINLLSKSKLSFNVYLKFLEKMINIDDILFKKIFYIFKPTYFNAITQNKYDVLKINGLTKKLNLNDSEEIMRFCEFYDFIPGILENIFDVNVLNEEAQKQEELIKKYIEIILSINHISAKAINFFDNYKNFYSFSEKIENQFYEKQKFSLYVFSKAIRTKKFSLDETKRIPVLEKIYLYYLYYSKDLGSIVKPEISMLQYLYPIMDKSKMNIAKIILFNRLPQSYQDVDYVIKNYSNDDINFYLKNIILFSDNNSETINLIYDWAYNGEIKLQKETYFSLLKNTNMDKRLKTQFGVLNKKKKLC